MMSYEAWGDDEPDNYDHLYDAGWWDSDQVEAVKCAIEALRRTRVYQDGQMEKGINVEFLMRINLLASEAGLMDQGDPVVVEAREYFNAKDAEDPCDLRHLTRTAPSGAKPGEVG